MQKEMTPKENVKEIKNCIGERDKAESTYLGL